MKKLINLLTVGLISVPLLANDLTISLSTTERPRNLGGISENYEPKRLHLEFEEEGRFLYLQTRRDDGMSDYALGTGWIWNFKNIFSKLGGGLGYLSDDFKKHTYNLNFHFIGEVGIRLPLNSCDLSLSRYLDHFSVGRDNNPFIDRNGRNNGVNLYGWKGGIICPIGKT